MAYTAQPILEEGVDWTPQLAGAGTVVHLAGRAPVMGEAGADPRAAYWRVNVEATEALARDAARAGVRQIVFVSSVKVLGEHSREPLTAPSPLAP